MKTLVLTTIISGGQTGADMAGLLAAKALNLKTGGFCPKGGKTELGNKPELISIYGLIETDATGYAQRTMANIQASDMTVLFGNQDSPGSKLTVRLCKQLAKVCLMNPGPDQLRDMLIEHQVGVLNVAGNRESVNPGIEKSVFDLLYEALE